MNTSKMNETITQGNSLAINLKVFITVFYV